MAITPRTIFSSAAPATVAAVSLLAFTAVGTVAYMSAQQCDRSEKGAETPTAATSTGCEDLGEALGADRAKWSERDWVQYASCYKRQKNARAAIDAAAEGLKHYPSSASLYNIKGYHEITVERHVDAIETLRTGLNRVDAPYTGVLENNLAWAGLWAPREMSLEEARSLYRKALEKEPDVCAYQHTGLWVEYATARQASGVDRFEALRAFNDLRSDYASCLDRVDEEGWKTVAEIAGAGVMYSDLAEGQDGVASEDESTPSGEEILNEVARTVKHKYSGVGIDGLCNDAMPVSTTHQTCVEQLNAAMDRVENGNTKGEKTDEESAGVLGGGGSPCPAMAE